MPERPALLYLSEVSHEYEGRSFCFGGGLYIDPVFKPYDLTALVGRSGDDARGNRRPVEIPPPSAIDYYGMITPDEARPIATGESVIFGFRPQAFVTSAVVVPISGIATGAPKVEGIWTPFGTPWLGEAHYRSNTHG